MYFERLKQANVSVHVIATGAGAGFQQKLWEVPGSSAYLSGCTFPYAPEEQEELLGFMPEHFVSEDGAVDLASAAYMKAYRFGGKNPIGIGITASVASEKEHRGEHRVYICTITNDSVRLLHNSFKKGVGQVQRIADGNDCDNWGFTMLVDAAKMQHFSNAYDATELARNRFFERPFFTANGKRLASLPESKRLAIMPGAYNPPHAGHTSTAQHVMEDFGKTVVYEVTAAPPHKEAMSVQDLLQRAKLLHGTDRLFTKNNPFYLDKARAFPGVPLVLGADAMVRMLDPKWELDLHKMFTEFAVLNTTLLISGRLIGDQFVSCDNILRNIKQQDSRLWQLAQGVMLPVSGRVDISSTELRNKLV